MREELFEAIKERLMTDVPDVKHIDLWNHNVEFIEQEDSWDRPAVFVEFGPIAWKQYTNKSLRGTGTVRLHLVTDWDDGGQMAAFGLGKKVFKALDGLCGDTFNGMALMETATNHNHEDILESIDSYAVRYLLVAD